MTLQSENTALLQRINSRFRAKTQPKSITKYNVADTFDEMAGLVMQSILGLATTEQLDAFRAGVPADGDNLLKLYQSIAGLKTILESDDVQLQDFQDLIDTLRENSDLIATLTSGTVKTSMIINHLSQGYAGKVLDAYQGKLLNDRLNSLQNTVAQYMSNAYINTQIATLLDNVPSPGNTLKKLYTEILNIKTLLNSDDLDLDSVQEIVTKLKGSADLISALAADKINQSQIVNSLTQVPTGSVLDAHQGKILKDLCDVLKDRLDNLHGEITAGRGIAIAQNGTASVKLGRGLKFDNTDNVTLDADPAENTIVTPVISCTWTAMVNDLSGPYNIDADNTSYEKNIIVEKGAKVSLTAKFVSPAPAAGQSSPTAVTGSFGVTLPAPGVDSVPLIVSPIAAEATYTVNLLKPKTGLMISGEKIVNAVGNNITTASISVKFQTKGCVFFSSVNLLNSAELRAIIAGNTTSAFQDKVTREFTAVSAAEDQYLFYTFERALGSVTGVIINGGADIFTAFTQQSDVTVTNGAGVPIVMALFRSNAKGAFLNDKLKFIGQ